MKFAANLNFLFTEGAPTMAEKLRRAAAAGFKAVEIPYPGADALADVQAVQKELNIEVALINTAAGADALAFGSAAVTGAENEFKHALNNTIAAAKALGCGKIHITAGLTPKTGTYEQHLCTYVQNLKYALPELEAAQLTAVIEPINKYALPGYFLNSYDTALQVLEEIKNPRLKLLLDVFHLQHIRGNVAHTFAELAASIGHVQIAQVPHRHEPDVAGELDYGYVFQLIRESGYNDWIGCEYKPKSTTLEGLKWVKAFGEQL